MDTNHELRGEHSPTTEEIDPKNYSAKVALLNRAKRRRLRFEGRQRISGSPMTAGRAPGKTGKPAWMAEIDARAAMRTALRFLKTEALVVDLGKPAMLLQGAFRNVWALSQASRAEVLAVPGVGEATAKKVHAYLSEKGVPMRWEV